MLRDAVPSLRRLGFEPIVLTTGERRGDFESAFAALEVPILHLPFSRNLGFARALRRLVRDHRIDVVHVHTERANALVAASAKSAGASIVRTVHNVFAYRGVLRVQRIAERAILRMLGVRHLSISPSVEANERHRLLNPTRRVDNWVGPTFRPATQDERVAARRALGVDEAAMVLTTIGNCSAIKNHVAVIEALPTLALELGRPIVYLHAGTGASEADERSLATAHGGATFETRFLGTVQDVRPLLWATDVYCMPSHYEGMPIAALEALASGIPSVLADVPGLRDVYPRAGSVRLTPPSSDGVASGVVDLVTRGNAVRELAAEVAEVVRRERGVERGATAWAAIYRSP